MKPLAIIWGNFLSFETNPYFAGLIFGKELYQNKLHIFGGIFDSVVVLRAARKCKKSPGDQVKNRQRCVGYFDTIPKEFA